MRTVALSVLVTGVLLGTASHAATADPGTGGQVVADKPEAEAEEETSEADFCHPDVMEQYFPLSLNDGLHEAVEDIKVMTFVLNILPFGGLWGPLVTLPDDQPEINSDILLSALIPWFAGWGIAVGFSMVGTVLAIPTGGLCGIVGCLGLVGLLPACYMAPIAVLHAWDRAYKCDDVSTGLDKLKSKKSKKGKTPKAKSKHKADGKKKAPPPSDDEDSGSAY
ncbi:MAG: hypothetical protein ABIJ09_14495 [Pseudomonadota bacterium]